MSEETRCIYLAGVHSSGKSDLITRVAWALNGYVVPRLERPQLIDEMLLRDLRRGVSTAFRRVHENIHERFRLTLVEWEQHAHQSANTGSLLMSDRSPFDAKCYHEALLRLGWLKEDDCQICRNWRRTLSDVTFQSAGVFLDPSEPGLESEFAARGMRRFRPEEFASGYLLTSAREFRRHYALLAARSRYWSHVGRVDEPSITAAIDVVVRRLRARSKCC